MSSWADLSSSLAGALVLAVGILSPKVVSAVERLLDRIGKPSSVAEVEPEAPKEGVPS